MEGDTQMRNRLAGANRLHEASACPDQYQTGRPQSATGDPRRQDPLDRLISRAVVDPVFRLQLLADPGCALALERMPLVLKRALAAIRARDLGDFAVQALDALSRLGSRLYPAERVRPVRGARSGDTRRARAEWPGRRRLPARAAP
jgi:hypothetical protein